MSAGAPEAAEATGSATRAGLRRWLSALHSGSIGRAPALTALVALLLLAAVISPVSATGVPIFFEWGNLTDILRQVSIIGILALGLTFVILTGGIDLSVGSFLALSSVLLAALLTSPPTGLPPGFVAPLAMLAALAACTLLGALNGIVVGRFGVQPFIATLAAMIGVRGLAKWFSDNENIDIGFGSELPARFAETLSQKIVVTASYALLAGLFWFLLVRTVFGRQMRAIGDNPVAARYAGLPILRTQIWVYALSGLLAGFAGILYAAENRQGNPNAGIAYELDAIAAVVIGGTRLAGGQGTISGTIVGTLIMGVLTNMLRLNNVDSNLEMMIKAVIIILAAALQRKELR